MKLLRKVIFWLHLSAGTFAGTVILIMSVTGILLVFEKQIIGWVDRSQHSTSFSATGNRLPIESLLIRARDAGSGLPSSLTLRSDPREPAVLNFGRDRTLLVDPYSGEILGEASPRVRGFFRTITDWHRWLGAQGENREVAKATTGACNLTFVFLVITGFYLWWPKSWTRAQIRSVTWFRRRLPGKARDFNWHNVVGFWCAVPLFVIAVSGVVISYQWASDLVYRAVGEQPPKSGESPGRRGPGPESTGRSRHASSPDKGVGQEAVQRRFAGEQKREGGHETHSAAGLAASGDPLLNLDSSALTQMWAQVERQIPGWKSITLRLPSSANAALMFTIDQGSGGQPQMRSQITLNLASGEVMRWEPFSSLSRGRRLRLLLRFAHTGEVAGILGQMTAGLAAGGATVLVWTGLGLAWRRLRSWQTRSRSDNPIEVAERL